MTYLMIFLEKIKEYYYYNKKYQNMLNLQIQIFSKYNILIINFIIHKYFFNQIQINNRKYI